MALQPSDLERLHRLSSRHKGEVLSHDWASCFYHRGSFKLDARPITEWCDMGLTALCPICGIDAILPGIVDLDDLAQMYAHWFGERTSRSYGMSKKGKAGIRAPAVVLEDGHVDLDQLCLRANQMAREKGFWDETPEEPGRLTSIGAKIALIHAEVSEALEEYRDGHPLDEVRIEEGKPEGLAIELADVVIRVADLAQHCGIELGAAVNMKLRYNATRPVRHGGKRI